jgi:hypothetical protein
MFRTGVISQNTWILRNFADASYGILKVYAVFHPPWFLETIH